VDPKIKQIVFTLHDNRLDGTCSLVRFKKAGANDWLLIKSKD
jgi:hypothetical protein